MFGRLSVVRRAARTTVSRFHTATTPREASQFTMPALSPTMTEGGIARWEKKEGEEYSAGDVLLQIETDKAQMDVEAQDDGILVKILKPEGSQGVGVNCPIAIVAEQGDDLASIDIAALSKQKETAAENVHETEKPKETEKETGKKKESTPVAQESHHHEADRSASGVLAPAAAFAVHANHIANPGDIQGTGPKGRVLKGDVLKFLKDGKAVITKPSEPSPTPSAPKTPAPKTAAAPSADAETAFLVQSLASSVHRHLADLQLARQSTVVRVPFDKLSGLLKANKTLSLEAFALRAAALAAQHVAVAKNTTVGVASEGSRGPVALEIPGAASAGVAELAQALADSRKQGQSGAPETPAVILAAEGVYSPETLPQGAVVVLVGAPYMAVSETQAKGTLDWALAQLVGGTHASSGKPAKIEAAQRVVDVRVVGESPNVPAFAAKIKALMANPELLSF